MLKGKMIRAVDGSSTILFGLSHENLDRLRNGEPILVDMAEIESADCPIHEILIFAGTDEDEMANEFRKRGLIP